MPGPDTEAAESGVLVAFYMGLSALLMWAMYRGLHYVWMHTIGYAIGQIANVGIPTGFFGKVHPLRWLEWVNNTVMNFLAEQALANEQAMGRWFHVAAHLQEWILRETYGLGLDVFNWLDGFHHHLIGKVLKAFFYPVGQAIRALQVTVRAVERAALAAERKQAAIAHDLPGDIFRGLKKGLPWAIPGIGLIPGLIKDVRGISHWVARHNRRLKRLELLLGVTGMAAAISNVFGTSAKCVRSTGPVGRMMRGFCGLPGTLFKDIFALIGDFFLFETLCDVIPVLATITSEVATPMVEALTPIEAGLCDKNHTVAAPLPTLTTYNYQPVASLTAGV